MAPLIMFPIPSHGPDWVLWIAAASLMLVVAYIPQVSRKRVAAGVVCALILCGALYAQQPVHNPDYCKDLEPWSALWIFFGCFLGNG
jgi:hypothetical protein